MGTDPPADLHDSGRSRPILWLEEVVPEPYHGPVGATLVVAIGTLSVVFHAWHLWQTGDSLVAMFFGLGLPIVLAALLTVAGAWLPRTRYAEWALLIGAWCLVGMGLVAGIVVITIQYQAALGVELANLGLVLSGTATAGGVVGLLIGIYDAERRLSEGRMAAQHETAQELWRRLSVLNRVLRHDIRNDVNVIHGNADRILDGDPVTEPATTIQKKASKLLRLSESARRIEALLEQDDFPTEPIDVATLVEAKAEEVSSGLEELELETVTPGSAWARANPMLESALEHIIENAIEHNDAETPEISVRVHLAAGRVTIEVADNGPGLPTSEIEVLERGHETDLDHGSGLGLWIANWIVTESGGQLAFEPNEPRGSIVRIVLPRTDPDG